MAPGDLYIFGWASSFMYGFRDSILSKIQVDTLDSLNVV